MAHGFTHATKAEFVPRVGSQPVHAPVVATKAGAPVDSDFNGTPPLGTLVLNTSTHALYVRAASGWRTVATSAV